MVADIELLRVKYRTLFVAANAVTDASRPQGVAGTLPSGPEIA